MTTLRRAVLGEKQNSSGNLEILLGIRRHEKFSGRDENLAGHCRKKPGHETQFLFCKVN